MTGNWAIRTVTHSDKSLPDSAYPTQVTFVSQTVRKSGSGLANKARQRAVVDAREGGGVREQRERGKLY